MTAARRGRKIARDVARIEFRKGHIRLALAILLWPPGWSHTRLDATPWREEPSRRSGSMPTDDQARSAAQEDEARTDDGLQEQADAVREMEERNGEVWDELDRKDRTAASVNPVATELHAEFPLLWEQAQAFDFAERLGGCTDPLLAEIDRAMRELWLARTNLRETA